MKYRNHKTYEVLQFIIDFKIDNNGNSPTTEEIRVGVELSSKSVVFQYLKWLEEDGLIERTRTSSQGIRHAARISVPGIRVYWTGPNDLLELTGEQ